VIPELVEWSVDNVKRSDPQLLESGLLTLRGNCGVNCSFAQGSRATVGDGWKGLPNESPFDAIHVGAAAASKFSIRSSNARRSDLGLKLYRLH
jgi:hypothetical protein